MERIRYGAILYPAGMQDKWKIDPRPLFEPKLEEITTSISSEATVRGMLMNLLDRE